MKKSYPDISLIIPVHDRAVELKRALTSVFAQTVPVSEIIVVDDASTDDVLHACETCKERVEYIRFETNRGVSAARNAGIDRASHEWIALLDSDDEWLPDKMEKQWEYFHKNPELTVLQSEEIWVRNGIRVNPMNKHRKYEGDIFIESLPLCIVSPSAVMFKKELFYELGGFDEALPVCEDYDLWLRWSLSYPFGLVKEKGIIKYGGHKDQLSRRYWGMDRFRLKSLEKLLYDARLRGDRRQAVLRTMEEKLQIYLTGAAKRGRKDEEFESMLQELKARDGV